MGTDFLAGPVAIRQEDKA